MSETFNGLHEQLSKEKEWPMLYFFKFIVPNDHQKLARVEALFGAEAQISINESRNGKYLSISAKEIMLSADEIIERYKKAQKIEGIISL